MTPSASVPLAELTPYLLRQTALRASILQSSFGFAADDWDDLRQDLALDCLRRLPRFDGARGSWEGFVRGVVRNHACVLASRQIHRPQLQSLDGGDGSELPDGKAHEPCVDDFRSVLEFGLDTERVLTGLPNDLRNIARLLGEMPVAAACRHTGLTLAQMNRRIRQIRAAFTAAGLGPAKRGGYR